MTASLESEFLAQRFSNDYQLVNGVEMHQQNGNQFQIPPGVIKRHLRPGFFVELRVDSPRFAMHDEDAAQCACPSCHGEMSKPILSHQHPESVVPLPEQNVPSRGWGEDFWVKITERDESYFSGVIDNRLAEVRLHALEYQSPIYFHEDHVLALHPSQREELVFSMDTASLKELAVWLGEQRSR